MSTYFKNSTAPFGYTPNMTADANKARVKIALMELGLNPCQTALHKCPWDFLATDGTPDHVLRIKVKTVTRRRKGYYTYHLPVSRTFDLLALVWKEHIGFHRQDGLPPSAQYGEIYFQREALMDILLAWGLYGQE